MDSPWRAHFGAKEDVRPEWRALYKRALVKKIAELQWRLLHGIIPVNSFISLLNPSVSNVCPSCPQREPFFKFF